MDSDILRAPRRKRKPSGDHREQRRVVKMTWDEDPGMTSSLFDDMGVSMLEDEDDDNCQEMEQLKPTPPNNPTLILDPLVVPGAPKITLLQQPRQTVIFPGDTAGSIYNPLGFLPPSIQEEFVLKRRSRTHPSDGYDHIDKLSDEVILSIFNWLPKTVLVRCARVCKRWYTLAMDETLWRRIDLANKTLKPGTLGRVLNRGVAVLRLTKTEVQTPLYPKLQMTLGKLSKVQYLDLSMAVVETKGLEQLLSTCHLLRKLSLEHVELNDTICRYIGQNRNLEVLNLCMCEGITENGLVPLCNNLKRLDALNIAWTNMSRGAVVYLVISLSPSVTKLNLSGCRETLLDEDVQQLCGSCPNIKELDLSDSTSLTSASIEYIAGLLRGLEYIALSRCYHITPSSLPLLGNIFTLLALDVFGVLKESALNQLRNLMSNIEINKFPFSSIARPTTGIRRTSIWGLRVRDSVV